MKKIIIFLFLILFTAGCAISVRTQKTSDMGVFRSDDSGETWSQIVYAGRVDKKELKIGNLPINKIIPEPDNLDVLYLMTSGRGIYKSENKGDLWQETGLKQGTFVNLAFDAENRNILYTASSNRVLKSVNAGKSWSVIYVETLPDQAITDIATDHYDARRVYVGTNKGALIKSDDYGNTWQILSWLNTAIRSIRINPHDSRTMYVITPGGGLRRSKDRGVSWTDLQENLKEYKGANKIQSFTFNHTSPAEFYLATDYGLLKTSNEGDDFEAITTLIKFGNRIDQIGLDMARTNNLYLTKDNKFHISKNHGQDWKTILLPTGGYASDIFVRSGQELNTIYLTILRK